jgi:hypothetical protein
MYFLQTDPLLTPSSNQGVGDFDFDTVEGINSNLLSISDFYEDGADITLTHQGFSGIRGTLKDGKPFEIPCFYSHEHKGWLVHFVMAKNPKDAAIHGKKIQSHLRSKTELRTDFLNDKQVLFCVWSSGACCRTSFVCSSI